MVHTTRLDLQVAQELLRSILKQEKLGLSEKGSCSCKSSGLHSSGLGSFALQRLHQELIRILSHHLRLGKKQQHNALQHRVSQSSKQKRQRKHI